jgi:hypothetical protein
MKRRRLVRHPLTLQSWQPIPHSAFRIPNLINAVALILEALCYIALGAGLAVLVQALHRAGVTP